MTVTEALKINASVSMDAPVSTFLLATGFTPLHLETLLQAHLHLLLTDRRVEITKGLYGDLRGTLQRFSSGNCDAAAVVLEWSDLDTRLGFRSAARLGRSTRSDVLSTAGETLDRIADSLKTMAKHVRVAVVLPTLPISPIFSSTSWRGTEDEFALELRARQFATEISHEASVVVVNPRGLDLDSTPASRFDLSSDLLTGFPYSRSHADRVAWALARAIAPPVPKKGIITDLDNTLWAGIVGEVGPENVTWDLDHHSHFHALYQQLLQLLAEEGVLLGVASKNDPANAMKALERADLLLACERVYPVEVSWSAKSAAVTRILQAWNISADSVVFIDDSPMELAEVSSVHAGIECLLFPEKVSDGMEFLRKVRNLCGKERTSAEDALRLESIRRNVEFRELAGSTAAADSFLEKLDARITFNFHCAQEPRTLELVNKTNQFNLNGRRYTAGEWTRLLSREGAFVCSVAYEDKFGPLGTIAVINGLKLKDKVRIDTWVMSCRAFSRRIEHRSLRMLFDSFNPSEIWFDFESTAKNGPLRDWLRSLVGELTAKPLRLTRQQFDNTCPRLYHKVYEVETYVHA